VGVLAGKAGQDNAGIESKKEVLLVLFSTFFMETLSTQL
jgi:hypothetical protein